MRGLCWGGEWVVGGAGSVGWVLHVSIYLIHFTCCRATQ